MLTAWRSSAQGTGGKGIGSQQGSCSVGISLWLSLGLTTQKCNPLLGSSPLRPPGLSNLLAKIP